MLTNTLFFDLDDTLYPNSSGLWETIRDRMNDYMVELLDLPLDEIAKLRQHYLETYGTTLRGLQIHHQVDVDEYLAYVHDLPLQEFIKPDPGLGVLLRSLPQPRWIFTNADIHHAKRVLGILQIVGSFNGIIDIRALDFVCKPDPEAYWRAMKIAGITNPNECILFDDSLRNLSPAIELGWKTVLVARERPSTLPHRYLPTLHDLPQVMPELWNGTSIDTRGTSPMGKKS